MLVGLPRDSGSIRELALEAAALERLRVSAPVLESDQVARREIAGRSAAVDQAIDRQLSQMLVDATWYRGGNVQEVRSVADMNRLASDLADQTFHAAPVLRNELINRVRPSSNAVAAANALMRRMVEAGDKQDLGLEGFPPERAIYASLLRAAGLHRRDRRNRGAYKFGPPRDGPLANTFRLMWEEGERFLSDSAATPLKLAELYIRWARPPYGLRSGVLPLFALTLLLANETELALYLDGQFVPRLDAFFVDRMLQTADAVEIRKFEISAVRRVTLERLATLFSDAARGEFPLDALSIAKPLVAFVRSLHPWAKRTRTLEPITIAVRDAILKASDPIRLLFEDLPAACALGSTTLDDDAVSAEFRDAVGRAMDELRAAYPRLLDRLGMGIGSHLGADIATEEGRFRISERAVTVLGLSGDFRLDAFATRLKSPSNSLPWLESLGGLAANKPVRDWSDNDIERANFELTDLCSRFKRAEAVAASLGGHRADGTESIAIVLGSGADTKALLRTVDICSLDREIARAALEDLFSQLRRRNLPRSQILGIVTEIARQIILEEQVAKEEAVSLKGEAERPLKQWRH
jgi:hypothetical protein